MTLANNLPSASGIYRILCMANGKAYVGSTGNLRGRLKAHEKLLERGDHHCLSLQQDYNTHGIKAFKVEHQELNRDTVRMCEREEIERFRAHGLCYNAANVRDTEPRSRTANRVTTGYCLTPELKNWIETMAQQDGISASAFLSIILSKAKREAESCKSPLTPRL